MLSITTLDAELAGKLEPRTSRPAAKLAAIRTLTEAGIPTGVMIAPVIPGLTEHEMPSILEAAARAGATHASYVLLRLPMAVAGLFEEWLDRHRPAAKEKILGRIRATRTAGSMTLASVSGCAARDRSPTSSARSSTSTVASAG